jgi:hypothetical protein
MGTINKVGSVTISSPVLAGGITNASITTSTARPYSLATMDVDSELVYNAINRKLQIESTLDEIFLDIGSDVVFSGNKIEVPDSVIMRIKSEKGARTQVMPMVNPLTGPGRGGTAEPQQGYERSRTMQHMKIYYNEYSQAVMGEKWGMNYNDLQVYNYYEQEQPGLSKWFAEDEGKQYREALLETYAWPLEKTGTALTQNFNPNWWISNLEPGSQPAYSATPATFRTNITAAFAAADTGTNGVNANISLDNLLALEQYASDTKRVEPVTIGGKKSYVVLIPTTQYKKLIMTNDGQLGAVWEKVSCLSDMEQNFPGIVGRVGSLVIVADQRYPTIACTNSYANNTMTVEYVEPGNDDGRNKSVYAADSNAAWDIGYLLGKGAIVDWQVTPLHFEKEPTEYGKLYGSGAFTERGIQLGKYDIDTAGNAIKNFGSVVLAWTATSIVTTA